MLITNKTTFEITKDKYVTLNGDCLVACSADFNWKEIKEFISGCDSFKINFTVDGKLIETIDATTNKEFSDEQELVFRLSDYLSSRTLGTNASKTAKYFSEEYRKLMKKGKKGDIPFESLWKHYLNGILKIWMKK